MTDDESVQYIFHGNDRSPQIAPKWSFTAHGRAKKRTALSSLRRKPRTMDTVAPLIPSYSPRTNRTIALKRKVLLRSHCHLLNLYWKLFLISLRYGRQAGVYAGLSVILNSELEDYNVTSSASVGFKVWIQFILDWRVIYKSHHAYNRYRSKILMISLELEGLASWPVPELRLKLPSRDKLKSRMIESTVLASRRDCARRIMRSTWRILRITLDLTVSSIVLLVSFCKSVAVSLIISLVFKHKFTL